MEVFITIQVMNQSLLSGGKAFSEYLICCFYLIDFPLLCQSQSLVSLFRLALQRLLLTYLQQSLKALNDDFKTNFKVFEKEILKLLKNNEKFFRKKDYPNSIDLAREMNAVVSKWKKMDEIKNFYFEVNKKFNPEYVELIHKVK